MSTNRFAFLVLILIIPILSCGGQHAEIVLVDGDVFTVDDDQPWAQAIVIDGTTITAVFENAAVNRTNNDGEPEGGWLPHHKISVEEAMRAFTHYGAYACMKEDSVRGTITPGKLADITVIDRNIIESPDDLLSMGVEMTIVDGKVVFER